MARINIAETERDLKSFNITRGEFGASQQRNSDGTYGKYIKYKKVGTDLAEPYYPVNKTASAGLIDITKDAVWSMNPAVTQDNTISCYIKLYQPKLSSVLTGLYTSLDQGLSVIDEGLQTDSLKDTQIANPLRGHFLCNDLGWTIKLPMLSLISQSTSNRFGAGENGGASGISSFANDLKSAITNNSAFGVDPVGKNGKPAGFLSRWSSGKSGVVLASLGTNLGAMASDVGKIFFPAVSEIGTSRFYEESETVQYPLEITLLNTSDNFEKSLYHHELVNMLMYQFSANRRNRYVADSPVICTLEIPQIRWCPAMAISNFEYTTEGTVFQTIGGVNLPEVYKITFTVTEFFAPFRHLLEQYQLGNKLHAIETDPKKTICSHLNRGIDRLTELRRTLS